MLRSNDEINFEIICEHHMWTSHAEIRAEQICEHHMWTYLEIHL